MEFLVCIKQVPDDSVQVVLDEQTGMPAVDGIEPVVNAFDTYALEMAVRCKETCGGRVTVVAAGPKSWESSLKNCLAVGADEAILLCEEDSCMCGIFAQRLATAICEIEAARGVPFDVIFCGRESTDTRSGQVAATLAEQWKIGAAYDVVSVELGERQCLVKQDIETGHAILRLEMPCVLAVARPEYEPRYPTIKSKMAARRAKIPQYALPKTGSDSESTPQAQYSMPKGRAAGVLIQEKDAETGVQRALDALRQKAAL